MLLRGLRDRINGVVGAIIAGVMMFICGAIAAFIISPQQAVEWRRIQNLPDLDAGSLEATNSGDAVAITGILDGNPELDDGFVSYYREVWEVEFYEGDEDDSDDDEWRGDWDQIDKVSPDLNLTITGGSTTILADNTINMGGRIHDGPLVEGDGLNSADFEGRLLPGDSTRTFGYRNGDRVTVVGSKASTGGIAAKRIYGGDRVQLVEEIRQGARALFIGGIACMIGAPIMAGLGALASIFQRRRRGLIG